MCCANNQINAQELRKALNTYSGEAAMAIVELEGTDLGEVLERQIRSVPITLALVVVVVVKPWNAVAGWDDGIK